MGLLVTMQATRISPAATDLASGLLQWEDKGYIVEVR